MEIDDSILSEDLYPGNRKAMEGLLAGISASAIVPFVGAGASVPLYPLWTKLLHNLVEDARLSGAITEPRDLALLRTQIATDPLEVADSLEDAFQKEQFRARLSRAFESKNEATRCHDAVVALNAPEIVTVNYDDGLEVAYARARGLPPHSIRGSDRSELTRWRQGRLGRDRAAILHWHGVPSDPHGMIFTGDDYSRFYADADRLSFFQQIWRDQNLLAIGFGFSDPFLTRIADTVLRHLPADNSHYALVGVPAAQEISLLTRRQFSRKYRITPIFYEIMDLDGAQDHSNLVRLLEGFRLHSTPRATESPAPSELVTESDVADGNAEAQAAIKELERSLLVFNGKQLYVEPRLQPALVVEDDAEVATGSSMSVADVVGSSDHIAIVGHPEYGSSTLCRRLVSEISKSGGVAVHREASSLPNYKKKLEDEFKSLRRDSGATLILDSFNPERHERLLKEVRGLGWFARVIIVIKLPGWEAVTGLTDGSYGIEFRVLKLSQLEREDIRSLAKTMIDTSDGDLIEMAVDKSYQDLLALCIPLTPANTIMYLSVMAKEGDFSPLNRVQIVERYIQELIRRPSDIYTGAFNARNRADLISAFVYSMFDQGRTAVDERVWIDFCGKYKRDVLVEFDEKSLLEDLLDARIFVRAGGNIIFRYRFFYSYFLGRHVANRQSILQEILANDRHLMVEGLVEVITALSADSALIIEDLVAKLSEALDAVQSSYPLQEQDPFLQIEWPVSEEEEQGLWEPVAQRLAAGPADKAEIDKLKRSIQAERRTEDQQVALMEFDKLESRIVSYSGALVHGLNSSESLSGELKKRALQALFASYSLTYMVGLLHAPALARYRVFYWNGIVFVNKIKFSQDVEEDSTYKTFLVALAIANAVASKVASDLGSKKLSEAYRVFAAENDWVGIKRLMLFSLLIRSKPKNWDAAAESVIMGTNRKSFYLKFTLDVAFDQFDREVNTNQDRNLLKRIIAAMRAKRDLKKDSPGAKVISSALRQLEEKGMFAKRPTPEGPAPIEG